MGCEFRRSGTADEETIRQNRASVHMPLRPLSAGEMFMCRPDVRATMMQSCPRRANLITKCQKRASGSKNARVLKVKTHERRDCEPVIHKLKTSR